ncbi:kinase-like domain-containing protein, partial [Rhodocollybia butyracea]
YNAEGAFVGTVTTFLPGHGLPIDDKTVEHEAADRSLLFDTFLVVPLLQTKGLYAERKFSGNMDTGDNNDYIGKVVDAFAHHVVEETHGQFMLADLQGIVGPDRSITLFDPQAHSITGDTGEWDQGLVAIDKFCTEHHCNAVCRQLQLGKLKDKVVGELKDKAVGELKDKDVTRETPHRAWED